MARCQGGYRRALTCSDGSGNINASSKHVSVLGRECVIPDF